MIIKRKFRHKKLFQMKKLLDSIAGDIDKQKYLEPTDILLCIESIYDNYLQYCIENKYLIEKDKKEGYQWKNKNMFIKKEIFI